MDTTQFLLSTAVTITTILLIIVSVQLISLLKQLKKGHFKVDSHIVKSRENPPAGGKKEKSVKKKENLNSLLEKIKNLSPHKHLSKKKFFKSV